MFERPPYLDKDRITPPVPTQITRRWLLTRFGVAAAEIAVGSKLPEPFGSSVEFGGVITAFTTCVPPVCNLGEPLIYGPVMAGVALGIELGSPALGIERRISKE